MFNEDESGIFIDFDTGSLKVYVLRGTKTCARRRGYNRPQVTLVVCVCDDGCYVRPALLWPSALTRGDLVQHVACPISVKATKTGWSSEDIFVRWLREFACLTSPIANPHQAVVLIVDGSKTHLPRAIIEGAGKLGVFVKFVTESLMQCVTPSFIMSGLRRAGVSPFSPGNFLASLDPCRLASQTLPHLLQNLLQNLLLKLCYPHVKHLHKDFRR